MAATRWTQRLNALQTELYTLYNAMKHAQVPWFAKAVAAATIAYQLSPIQLIPDWVPVLGFADNFIALAIALAFLRAVTPANVLAECRERAQHAVALQAQQGAASRAVLVCVAVAWLAIGVLITLLVTHALLGRWWLIA
jgi:uncharacterized membrane protein YkvA (DUF1232 family)